MKTEEIVEGNKLIAVFMGGQYLRKKDMFDDTVIREIIHFPKGVLRDDVWDGSHGGCEDELVQLLYHKYWGWLMPVVIRINTTENACAAINIDTTRTFLHYGLSTYTSKMETFMYKDMPIMEAIWLAVVTFIKWYNQTSK